MSSFTIKDLFSLEKLFATRILKIFYIVGLIGIAIGTIVAIVSAFNMMRYNPAQGIGQIVLGIVGGVAGVVVFRLVVEAWYVLFGIYERLGDIRESLRKD